MRVAVIGADGQLGSDVVRAFGDNGDEVCAMTHSDIEISNIDSAWNGLRDLRPQVVVNTAAMHHLDKCELAPDKAHAVNALGPRNLALVARDIGAVLMHVSTDYVFDGNQTVPYEETDTPRPLNVYGNTKLSGEHFVRSTTEKHFVIRTSGLYGKQPCRGKGGLNFVELMLKLAKERPEMRVVDSESVTPTYTVELAQQLVVLSRRDCYGLYHGTAEGSCSWFDFARTILGMTNTAASLKIAGPSDFPSKVPRPKYSVLENRALKAQGLNRFGPWQIGLCRYLEQRCAAN